MIYFTAKNIGTFGGAAVVAMDIVDSLLQSEIRFRTICSQFKVPEERAKAFSGLERLKMPFLPDRENYEKAKFGGVRYLLKRTQYVYDRRRLNNELNRMPPELMIFNGYRPSTKKVIDDYSGRCKTIQIVHVSPTFVDEFEDFITVKELLATFKKSDALVFVSDECRKKWLKYPELENCTSYYIPNCAKEDVAKQNLDHSKSDTRKKLNLDQDRFYLVSVASFQERKGQDLLVDAAPRLKEIAPNLEILFIGGDGGEFVQNQKTRVKDSGLDFITFMGRKENAMEYIYASDTFILTSRAEAFPLVLLESMILKTPMIGSNVDGVPEMIKHDKTGLLFESENTGELVQMFEKMYRSRENREKVAAQASEMYWNEFSKEQFTKRYADLINKVLGEEG